MNRRVVSPFFLTLYLFSCLSAQNLPFIPHQISGHPEFMSSDLQREIIDITNLWELDLQSQHTTYRQTFDAPKDWQEKKVFFWIDDAYPVVKITINSRNIGTYIHSDHVSASMDITNHIQLGQENSITLTILPDDYIKVDDDSSREKFIAPAGPRHWIEKTPTAKKHALRGKTFLIALNDIYISSSMAQTNIDNKTVKFTAKIENTLDYNKPVKIVAQLYEIGVKTEPQLILTYNPKILTTAEKQIYLKPSTSTQVTLDIPFPDEFKLWQPDDPFLYMYKIKIFAGQKLIDVYTDRIGLRTFGINGPDFMLNGRKFLPRLVFTSCWNEYGGWDVNEITKVVTKFKDTYGYNLFRSHGWPRSRYFFLLTDQYGLPMICEAALAFGNWYDVENSDSPLWGHWKTHGKRLLDQYGNHPSIVIWSAENEILSEPRIIDKTGEIHENLWQINDLFKTLDPSRPVMFEGDLDLRGKCQIINEHYPLRYGNYLWPNDFYWLDKPHIPVQADGSFFYKKIKWDRSKPYVFGETMWFPTGGPVPHTPFTGDKIYEYFIKYPHSRWNIGDNFNSFDMLSRAYHMQKVSGFVVQSSTDLIPHLKYKYNNGLTAYVKQEFRHYYSQNKLKRDFVICNSLYDDYDITLLVKLIVNGKSKSEQKIPFHIAAGDRVVSDFTIDLPEVNISGKAQLKLELWKNDHLADTLIQNIKIYPQKTVAPFASGNVAILDNTKKTSGVIKELGLDFQCIENLSQLSGNTDLLIIAENFLGSDSNISKELISDFLSKGKNILMLAQSAKADLSFLGFDLTLDDSRLATMAHRLTAHPLFDLADLEPDDFKWWLDDHFVAKSCYRKPVAGNYQCILEVGDGGGLKYTPLIEIFKDGGIILANQLTCIEKYNKAPIAREILTASINYLLTNSVDTGKLGLIAPAQNSILQKLETIGADFEIVEPDKITEQKLRQFKALVISNKLQCYENVLEKKDIILPWVYRENGKVILHSVEPQFLEKLNELVFPHKFILQKAPKTTLYKTNNSDTLITGLSNETLWWISSNAPTASPEENLKDSMIDFYIQQHPSAMYPSEDWCVLTAPAGLARLKFGQGMFIFDQLKWDTASLGVDKQLEYLRWLLTASKVKLNFELNDSVDLSQAKFVKLDISEFCNQYFKDTGSGGAWFDLGPNLDLRNIPTGTQLLAKVEFDVLNPDSDGNSCIVLNGRHGENFPKKTKEIPVDKNLNYIAFHHASGYANPGEIIGTYRIHYTNGQTEDAQVIESLNVKDWYNGPSLLSQAKQAWVGKTLGNRDVSTYCYIWENPHPQNQIKTIEIFAGNPQEKMMQGILQHGMLAVISITGVE